MKKAFVFSLFALSLSVTHALADIVAYKERFSDGTIHMHFQHLYYPRDCSFISRIGGEPERYIVRDEENFSTVARKCFLLNAGKKVKEGTDKVLSIGREFYDKSGMGSFFKGLLGN